MAESIFMKVSEVAKELGVSESYAYKLVRQLNIKHTHDKITMKK